MVVRNAALIALFGWSATLSADLQAQASASARPVRVDVPSPLLEAISTSATIRIDGRLNESVWRAAPKITGFVQAEPSAGAKPSRATEVRMLVTPNGVIIGARLDDDSAALFSGSGVTSGLVSDYFEVLIDAHPGHTSALSLHVSPAGAKRSGLVNQDGTRNDTWVVHWDAATSVDAKGWTVEIRIPLSELHYRPGYESWGVRFERFSMFRQETDRIRPGTAADSAVDSPSQTPPLALTRSRP